MNLSKHISHGKMKKGFTLIELLIVIGILGILAAGLLAAIDPLDQIKKARDSNRLSAASELSSALQRYYANRGQTPWNANTVFGTNAAGTAGVQAVTASLISVGELKSTFTWPAVNGSTNLPIINSFSSGDVYVCFTGEAKAANNNTNAIYNTTGPAGTAPVVSSVCPAPNTGSSSPVCYICAH